MKHPEKVDMVIFRENTEDIYAGIDFEAGKEAALKTIEFLKANFPKDFKKIRFGETPDVVGIGIKPVSKTGTQRLFRSAIQYAITNKTQDRDDCPQGQHHEIHRRRLPRLGLRTGQERIRRGGDGRRAVVQNSRRQTRRGPRHQGRHRRHHARSKCSPARRISTSSPR